jgi:hypothetical protein
MGKVKKEAAPHLMTCVGLLRKRLESIEAKMMELLDCSSIIVGRNDPYGGTFMVEPRTHWGQPDDKQRRLQIELKGVYAGWFEQFDLLLSDATSDLRRQIGEVDSFVRRWIEKEESWDLSTKMDENEAHFKQQILVIYGTLQTLDDPRHARVVVLPDTNSLIRCPEPAKYAAVVGAATYDFVLLPTVLGELDELKIKHRDEGFRQKVEGVIRRIKGWRNQGNLLDGVTVNKTVTVRTVAREPNFERTLHWLDKTNRDDRIVASVLELQRAMPSAALLLVTGDINLQNKAEAASVPHAETPPGTLVP